MEKETKKTEVAVEVLDKDGEVIENEYTVVFNKPYTFEGETYDKIDLSGLDNLTAADMIAANKILDRTGSFTFLPEMSLEYACIIAAKQPNFRWNFSRDYTRRKQSRSRTV